MCKVLTPASSPAFATAKVSSNSSSICFCGFMSNQTIHGPQIVKCQFSLASHAELEYLDPNLSSLRTDMNEESINACKSQLRPQS